MTGTSSVLMTLALSPATSTTLTRGGWSGHTVAQWSNMSASWMRMKETPPAGMARESSMTNTPPRPESTAWCPSRKRPCRPFLLLCSYTFSMWPSMNSTLAATASMRGTSSRYSASMMPTCTAERSVMYQVKKGDLQYTASARSMMACVRANLSGTWGDRCGGVRGAVRCGEPPRSSAQRATRSCCPPRSSLLRNHMPPAPCCRGGRLSRPVTTSSSCSSCTCGCTWGWVLERCRLRGDGGPRGRCVSRKGVSSEGWGPWQVLQ
mmetsp:Transcript_24934/g.54234  ORF Transcript_24934/g.54234 Transcript_24934/m.54234 type:complete len:264 (+) Transcript_24934:3556-4347(+)